MAATRAELATSILVRHLSALAPDVSREERAGRVEFRRGALLFAALRPLKRSVHVGFSRLGRARVPRILSARTGRMPGLWHRVVVEAPGDVDSELLTWLEESYEVVEEVAAFRARLQ